MNPNPSECYTQAHTALFQLFQIAAHDHQTLEVLRREIVSLTEQSQDLAANQDWTSRQVAELEQAVAEFVTQVQKQLVLYGSRALNLFLPEYLRTETNDWDFFMHSRDLEQLDHMCTRAVDFLQARFPGRRVWRRNSLHNPNGSVAVLISQRHVLDFSLPPEGLPEAELHHGFQTCPLAWLINNLEALLVNANANYRLKKDRSKLLRVLCAASDGHLSGGTLSRSHCKQLLISLGDLAKPLLLKLEAAKEQKQSAKRAQKLLQESELTRKQQSTIVEKLQKQVDQDRTEKLELELKHLKQSSTAKIAELQKANARLQTKIEVETKSREKLALERELDKVKYASELAEKEKLIQQLQQRVEEISQQVPDSTRMRHLEEQNRIMRSEYAVKAETLEVLQNSIEAESDKHRGKIAQLEASLASSNKRAGESIRTIVEQRKKLDTLGERSEKLEKELTESEKNNTQLLERFYQLRHELETVFCERAIPTAFGYVHWSRQAKQAKISVTIDQQESIVWLCETCQDGTTRVPPSEPCAVLKLQLGKSEKPDITMPVQRNGTLYSICNSCFYENLVLQ